MLWYGSVTLIEVAYDHFSRVRVLGLVSLASVVAEIWGEHSPCSEISSVGGVDHRMALREVVIWSCTFNRGWGGSPAGFFMLHLG